MDANQHKREQVRNIISERLHLKNDSAEFLDVDSLFVSGRLDSMDSIALILFLEEKFGVDFKESGFDLTLIDSVDAIMRLLEGV